MIEYGIGITGGIATGKSTACNILKLHGFSKIDADEISKDILNSAQEDVIKMFGDRYVINNKIDRKAIGKLIFSNKTEKHKLEAFLHPKIKLEIKKRCDKLEALKTPYLIDIPLLFETGNYDIKTSVLIYAPQSLQIQRAMTRDKLDKKNVLDRLSAQIDIEEKKSMANYTIDNSKNLKHLQAECEKFIKWLGI
jgi:dephospho-CoA kinase